MPDPDRERRDRESSGELTLVTRLGRATVRGSTWVLIILLVMSAMGGLGWVVNSQQKVRAEEHATMSRELTSQTDRLESIFWALLLTTDQRQEKLKSLPTPKWVQELVRDREMEEWRKAQPSGKR